MDIFEIKQNLIHPFDGLNFLKQPFDNGADCGVLFCSYIWNIVSGKKLQSNFTKKFYKDQEGIDNIVNDMRAYIVCAIFSKSQS